MCTRYVSSLESSDGVGHFIVIDSVTCRRVPDSPRFASVRAARVWIGDRYDPYDDGY